MAAFSLSEINSSRVTFRRMIFFGFNLVLLSVGIALMTSILAAQGWSALTITLLALFIVLQIPVVFGFSLAATGFFLLLRGSDGFRINNTIAPGDELKKLPATAVVMPIFNEDVGRVFQGLQLMFESLQKTGHGDDFDLVILSDSNDSNHWIAEEQAWLELCKRCHGLGRIIYRKRRVALHNKSGNIADFCRRWGSRYRYMIVLDADSIMTGSTMVRLVNLMEKNSRVGIIQTNPKAMGAKTLIQRMMQFSSQVYGGPFMAGMNFWQLASGNYWGHNAILRIEPFMKFCAMPELPKSSPLGTRILSHDTVEAALMRRAGYGVWFAYDLEGSYEELPPDLPALLQRDQRWCYGNLQHVWLLLSRRVRFANRIHILNGILGYASSPVWFLFLVLSTIQGARMAVAAPARLEMPGFYAARAGILFAYVIALLIVPKLMAAILLAKKPETAALFGGRIKIALGMFFEIIFSTLIAPIQMLFYTRFVLASITGKKITWNGQNRNSGSLPPWRQLIAVHGGDTIFAIAAGAVVAWLVPNLLPWMAILFVGPLLAIPLSRFSASEYLGKYARTRRLFLVPEELKSPIELAGLEHGFLPAPGDFFQAREYASEYGLIQAVLDPYINAAHVSLLHQRAQIPVRRRAFLNSLIERLLLDGPFILSAKEKRMLLWDADSMEIAHFKLWGSPASHLHEWWQAAFRHYNETTAMTIRREVAAR